MYNIIWIIVIGFVGGIIARFVSPDSRIARPESTDDFIGIVAVRRNLGPDQPL